MVVNANAHAYARRLECKRTSSMHVISCVNDGHTPLVLCAHAHRKVGQVHVHINLGRACACSSGSHAHAVRVATSARSGTHVHALEYIPHHIMQVMLGVVAHADQCRNGRSPCWHAGVIISWISQTHLLLEPCTCNMCAWMTHDTR